MTRKIGLAAIAVKFAGIASIVTGIGCADDAGARDVSSGVRLASLQITGKSRTFRPASAPPQPAKAPRGWEEFCKRYEKTDPQECRPDRRGAVVIPGDAETLDYIRRINIQVNHTIEPITDSDHWGVDEQWDLPRDGKGDCEDYALWKRHLLSEHFSTASLLVALVIDKNRDGHAVLMVKTSRGDYILDNLTNKMLLVQEVTQYDFRKLQSQGDPNVWIALTPDGQPQPQPQPPSCQNALCGQEQVAAIPVP